MNTMSPMFSDARPYVRWWWFSGPLTMQAIDEQLDWIALNGFGGVEIAWVYPNKKRDADEGPRFLDDDFKAFVCHAIGGCKRRNLGCDLTFGSLWPFSGTFIPESYTIKTLDGYPKQSVDRSWEARYSSKPALVLDHLDAKALQWYASYLFEHGFEDFCRIAPLSLFCDSWEVDPKNLGFDDFNEVFLNTYGYAYDATSDDIDQRFDYRCLISERVLSEFYEPFHSLCRLAGSSSRVQCHGAPTDILAAYSLVDIPESETLLFDPDFSLLAASAAAMEQKPIVSSETFSCLYGWVPTPATPPGMKEERIDDLRCIADAQFAWGVNRVVWHGKPFETIQDPHEFYATVHVGPNGSLEPFLPQFNEYLTKTSMFLTEGETFSNLSILLPLEDQWMADELPESLQKPSSRYYWELQELKIDEALLQYRPLWFSSQWIEALRFENGFLFYKERIIEALLCISEYLLHESLTSLQKLKNQGAPIYFVKQPKQPGSVKNPEYDALVKDLPIEHPKNLKPVLQASQPVDFWCRRDGNRYNLFISHPGMRSLRYPLAYGYAQSLKPMQIDATFHTPDYCYSIKLEFEQCSSLAFEIDDTAKTVRPVTL